MPTNRANKESTLHLWQNIRTSNDNSFNINQFANIIRTKMLHLNILFIIKILYTHHNRSLLYLLVSLRCNICFWLNEILLIDFFNDLIKARNHLCREVIKLQVQLFIKFLNMFSLNLKHIILSILKICQSGTIYLLGNKLIINCSGLFVFKYKFLYTCHHFSYVDVCAVNMLTLFTYHISTLQRGIMSILGIGIT